MISAVVDAAAAVQATSDVKAIGSTIERFIQEFSLDGYAITYLCHTADGPTASAITNVPEAFAATYSSQNFLRTDPLVERAARTPSPYVWNQVLAVQEQTPTIRRIIGLRTEYGMRNGYNVPIRTHRGISGVVSFFGDRNRFESGELLELQMFALIVQARLSELGQDIKQTSAAFRLTLREQETLKWGAMGKTSEDIANILGLTKRTVDQHFENAGRKLGTMNRVQTVVKAYMQNLITI